MSALHDSQDVPCVAIVGPANSGKTTFLHLLDETLQSHPSKPLAYVVRGSPDGGGRFLHYSPELRDPVKERSKGAWQEQTFSTIISWIGNARRHLEAVLVDIGGKRNGVQDQNRRMLERCSHYIVLSRPPKSPEEEAVEGAALWERDCREAGLQPIARIDSSQDHGPCTVASDPAGFLRGVFRSGASAPGDASNAPLIDAVAEAILALRVRRPVPYLDLRLDRDWMPQDLANMAGLLGHLDQAARTQSEIRLGGRAPLWAYAAAMHRILDRNPAAHIRTFYPICEDGFVTIPPAIGISAPAFPEEALAVKWGAEVHQGACDLDIRIVTRDRFLTPLMSESLAAAPLPQPPVCSARRVVLTGQIPVWLHLAYSRWLRSLGTLDSIGAWDARYTTPITVATSPWTT